MECIDLTIDDDEEKDDEEQEAGVANNNYHIRYNYHGATDNTLPSISHEPSNRSQHTAAKNDNEIVLGVDWTVDVVDLISCSSNTSDDDNNVVELPERIDGMASCTTAAFVWPLRQQQQSAGFNPRYLRNNCSTIDIKNNIGRFNSRTSVTETIPYAAYHGSARRLPPQAVASRTISDARDSRKYTSEQNIASTSVTNHPENRSSQRMGGPHQTNPSMDGMKRNYRQTQAMGDSAKIKSIESRGRFGPTRKHLARHRGDGDWRKAVGQSHGNHRSFAEGTDAQRRTPMMTYHRRNNMVGDHLPGQRKRLRPHQTTHTLATATAGNDPLAYFPAVSFAQAAHSSISEPTVKHSIQHSLERKNAELCEHNKHCENSRTATVSNRLGSKKACAISQMTENSVQMSNDSVGLRPVADSATQVGADPDLDAIMIPQKVSNATCNKEAFSTRKTNTNDFGVEGSPPSNSSNGLCNPSGGEACVGIDDSIDQSGLVCCKPEKGFHRSEEPNGDLRTGTHCLDMKNETSYSIGNIAWSVKMDSSGRSLCFAADCIAGPPNVQRFTQASSNPMSLSRSLERHSKSTTVDYKAYGKQDYDKETEGEQRINPNNEVEFHDMLDGVALPGTNYPINQGVCNTAEILVAHRDNESNGNTRGEEAERLEMRKASDPNGNVATPVNKDSQSTNCRSVCSAVDCAPGSAKIHTRSLEHRSKVTAAEDVGRSNSECPSINYIIIDDSSQEDDDDPSRATWTYTARNVGNKAFPVTGRRKKPRKKISCEKKRNRNHGCLFDAEENFNWTYSREAAVEMQERLLHEAAARVRTQLNLGNKNLPIDASIPVLLEPVIEVYAKYPNHWKWKDPWSCLGLPRNSPRTLIKCHYRKLARLYHPDKSKSSDTGAKFHAILSAYRSLCPV